MSTFLNFVTFFLIFVSFSTAYYTRYNRYTERNYYPTTSSYNDACQEFRDKENGVTWREFCQQAGGYCYNYPRVKCECPYKRKSSDYYGYYSGYSGNWDDVREKCVYSDSCFETITFIDNLGEKNFSTRYDFCESKGAYCSSEAGLTPDCWCNNTFKFWDDKEKRCNSLQEDPCLKTQKNDLNWNEYCQIGFGECFANETGTPECLCPQQRDMKWDEYNERCRFIDGCKENIGGEPGYYFCRSRGASCRSLNETADNNLAFECECDNKALEWNSTTSNCEQSKTGLCAQVRPSDQLTGFQFCKLGGANCTIDYRDSMSCKCKHGMYWDLIEKKCIYTDKCQAPMPPSDKSGYNFCKNKEKGRNCYCRVLYGKASCQCPNYYSTNVQTNYETTPEVWKIPIVTTTNSLEDFEKDDSWNKKFTETNILDIIIIGLLFITIALVLGSFCFCFFYFRRRPVPFIYPSFSHSSSFSSDVKPDFKYKYTQISNNQKF